MANYIPANGPIQHGIPTPLTLTALQTYVGGMIAFHDLKSGDTLVANEVAEKFAPLNTTASAFAGIPVHGDVVICEPQDIA